MPVVVGPTAGGKSALGLAVVERFGSLGLAAEIVTADAFQVYRGLDIGTAKPTPAERAAAPHHLIDLAEPTERFTLHDWLAAAEAAIGAIRGRGAVPVVVGGTHLYAKALLDGVFEGPKPDEMLRAELRAMGLPALRAELERADPEAAQRIHPNDERRAVRALEVFRQTGRPISELQGQWDAGPRDDAALVTLAWEPETINRRINARVRAMVEAGLIEEAHGLWRAGRLGPQAGQALGYKQLAAAFEAGAEPDAADPAVAEAVERTKIETRRFAKNQRTWLRRFGGNPGVLRLEPDGQDTAKMAQDVVTACLS